MASIQHSITIARPPASVFAYLADIGSHAEISDHYLVDWRLLREDPSGVGAGGRFRLKLPLRFTWADATIAEASAPHRVVLIGRAGKYNRVRTVVTWELHAASSGQTRVDFDLQSDPPLPSDKLLDALGGSWLRRKTRRQMRRLRSVLEEDYGRGRRPSAAAR